MLCVVVCFIELKAVGCQLFVGIPKCRSIGSQQLTGFEQVGKSLIKICRMSNQTSHVMCLFKRNALKGEPSLDGLFRSLLTVIDRCVQVWIGIGGQLVRRSQIVLSLQQPAADLDLDGIIHKGLYLRQERARREMSQPGAGGLLQRESLRVHQLLLSDFRGSVEHAVLDE